MENLISLFKSINVEYLIKYARLIVIILGFQLIGPIIAQIIIGIFHKIIKSDEKAKESGFYVPTKYFFYVLGFYISIYNLNVTAGILKLADKAFKIITIILITKGLADSIKPSSFIFKFINKDARRRKKDIANDALNLFLSKVFRTIIWIVAIFVVMSELNYDLSGLAAGLGIGSAVIALAAQDLVKSLMGGFVIITDKPFEIGDFIEVGTFTGTVIDISFRSTRIRGINNSIVTIPNSLISSEYITNWNKLESRRISTELRLGLDVTTEQINRCISKITTVLKTNEDVKEDTVQVHLSDIRADCNAILVVAYVKITAYNEFMKSKDRIYCDILDVLARENIELVYPSQTVYTKNVM